MDDATILYLNFVCICSQLILTLEGVKRGKRSENQGEGRQGVGVGWVGKRFDGCSQFYKPHASKLSRGCETQVCSWLACSSR